MHTHVAGSARPATAISVTSLPLADSAIPISNCQSIGSSLALRLFLAGIFALLGLAGCGSGGGGGDGSTADSNPTVNAGTTPVGTPPTVSATSTATLAWDASTAPNLAGYRFYYGTAPRSYRQPLGQGINVGIAMSYTVTGLSSGVTYYFAVTAFDRSGNESGYSTEVSKTIR